MKVWLQAQVLYNNSCTFYAQCCSHAFYYIHPILVHMHTQMSTNALKTELDVMTMLGVSTHKDGTSASAEKALLETVLNAQVCCKIHN